MTRSERPGNTILQKLPQTDYRRLAARLETVGFAAKDVVCNGTVPLRHAYFPLSGVLSVVIVMGNGTSVEAAAVGNEGLVGLPLLVGESACLQGVVQQVEGESLRLPARIFREALVQSRALAELVTRYSLALLHQTSQNAACNVLHTLDERMSRWLLSIGDRVGGDEFNLTHELLAETLGVHRQSVSIRAGVMQRAGVIAYRRGRLKILDRRKLEQSACECYGTMLTAYQDLLSSPLGSVA